MRKNVKVGIKIEEAISADLHADPQSWSNWNLEMLFFFVDEGTPETPEEKKPKNQQQTKPTYDTAGLEANLGHIGEDSHHCTISAPRELLPILNI